MVNASSCLVVERLPKDYNVVVQGIELRTSYPYRTDIHFGFIYWTSYSLRENAPWTSTPCMLTPTSTFYTKVLTTYYSTQNICQENAMYSYEPNLLTEEYEMRPHSRIP